MPDIRQNDRPVPASLASATAAELRRHAPFDRMSEADLQWMVSRLSLVYFAPGATALSPADGAAQHFCVVRQGALEGVDPASARSRWRLVQGECFPLGALLGKRAVTCVYRAEGDTFCWRLPAADFDVLLQRSPAFHDFCTRRLANLLAASGRALQSDYAALAAHDPLAQPLGSLVRRAPVVCDQFDTLRSALLRMREARVGSIVVRGDDEVPAGIFTLRDLRDRVALADADPQRAIASVMTPDPVRLPQEAPALEAALLMARHGFHHIVVTAAGKIAGVVSESDLFALRRVGMTGVSEAIRAAGSLDDLARAASDIHGLAETLIAQGVAAGQLTRIVSALNDLITRRLLELESAAAGIPAQTTCWLALGSEGRHEQTLATDQDNGILFHDPEDGDAQRVRERLLPFVRRVNAGLARCGFPLCKGEVMASNPRWCLSLAEWKQTFARWMDRPDGEALLNASIFFDFRPLWGAEGAAAGLREWLARTAPQCSVFLRLMAENALRNAPPLGVLRDFAVERHAATEASIDLKVNGVAPYVDAARILSLAVGDVHTGTAERLRAAADARKLDRAEVAAWVDAFQFIQMLRLRHQQAAVRAGGLADNYLQPDRLNALDRRILKEAFRQCRKLQERLRLDYHL